MHTSGKARAGFSSGKPKLLLNFISLLLLLTFSALSHTLPIEPGTLFRSRVLTFDEITQSLNRSVMFLRTLNPRINIVVTVSPVRHTRDTMVINSLSKSLLLAAVHNTIEQHEDICSYFPSYEYIMDELRYSYDEHWIVYNVTISIYLLIEIIDGMRMI